MQVCIDVYYIEDLIYILYIYINFISLYQYDRLANKIEPGTIKKINNSKMPFMQVCQSIYNITSDIYIFDKIIIFI